MSHVEVSRTIAAPPERLYQLVSNLPRMGEWSPEATGGTWVKGATGPAVGAKFKGTNRLGKRSWSTLVTVAVADPGREFTFDVTAAKMKVARWSYRFEPVEGGTRVTEGWDDGRSALVAAITGLVLGVPDRSVHNRKTMEQTLERLAAAAEA